jgi:DNA-binding NarL/FixJ family response regulator
MSEFRILIVDDCASFHDLLSRILAKSLALPALQVVCGSRDGLTAVREAKRFQPHLTLLDIGLPGQNGIRAARKIRLVAAPESKIIFVSTYCSAELLCEAMGTGDGYVLKSDVVRDLPAAVQAVILDKQFISERLAGYNLSASADL